MGTVTHKSQPGVKKSAVPLEGRETVYKTTKVLWSKPTEAFIKSLIVGSCAHICCGMSRLGDVRVDTNEETEPTFLCDAANLRSVIGDKSFDTVLCDPPYSGKMQWNHDVLSELSRIARSRIIFQHWFIPATKLGFYKKAQDDFMLSEVYIWQPQTYFGRVNVISIFDNYKENA